MPWQKLCEYFFRLSSCRTRRELLHTACVEIQRLIPYDQTAGVFNTSDDRNIEGIGKTEACTAAYNTHYRTTIPPHSSPITDWQAFKACEFTDDFMFPNEMYKSMSPRIAGHRIFVKIQRSRRSPIFSESELHVLELVDEFLNNLYSTLETKQDTLNLALTPERIAERFGGLSTRETEVCSLIACRLNTAEIASSLFISPRTVEVHVAKIFEKLDVQSREQLRWRIGVLPLAGILHSE